MANVISARTDDHHMARLQALAKEAGVPLSTFARRHLEGLCDAKDAPADAPPEPSPQPAPAPAAPAPVADATVLPTPAKEEPKRKRRRPGVLY